jgi:hypothetical protein
MRTYSYTFYHEYHSHFLRHGRNPLHYIRIQRQIHILHQIPTKDSCFLVQFGTIYFSKCTTNLAIFITYLCTYSVPSQHPLNSGEQSLLASFEHRLPHAQNIWVSQTMGCWHPEIIVRLLRAHMVDPWCIHMLRLAIYLPGRMGNCKANYWWTVVAIELNNFIEQSIQSCRNHCRSSAYHRHNKLAQTKWHTVAFSPPLVQPMIDYIRCPGYIHYARYGSYMLWGGDTHELDLFYRRWARFIYRRFAMTTILQYKERIEWGPWLSAKRVYAYNCQVTSLLKGITVTVTLPVLAWIYPSIFVHSQLKGVYISNITGIPRSKFDWIRLSDSQIVSFFQTTYMYYQCLYSGATNYRMLQRYLAYVLRYACAKTLAVKHKRSIRFVLDRLVFKMPNSASLERQWYITWLGQDPSLEVSGFEPLTSALQGRRSTN